MSAPFDLIIAYEAGELEEDEVIALFQDLVNSGLAWKLQGHYGRTAMGLLAAGLIQQQTHEPDDSSATFGEIYAKRTRGDL